MTSSRYRVMKMDLPIRQFPELRCGARMLMVHWISLTGDGVETVPFRLVTFAENVETVEFDPAVHKPLSSVIENNASAPNVTYKDICSTCSHG